jgi:hypothetical protein
VEVSETRVDPDSGWGPGKAETSLTLQFVSAAPLAAEEKEIREREKESKRVRGWRHSEWAMGS